MYVSENTAREKVISLWEIRRRDIFHTKRTRKIWGKEGMNMVTERVSKPKSRLKCTGFNWSESEAP